MISAATLTDQQFTSISKLIYNSCGIKLPDGKQTMVLRRLTPRLRKLGISDVGEYLSIVEKSGGDELGTLVNLVTTNFTNFFREPHHFKYLSEVFIPQFVRENSNGRKLRIWCAASSTGEEPYSIAMTVKEQADILGRIDVGIVATDIDTNVLATAARGIYKEEKVASIPEERLRQWFKRGKGANAGLYQAKDELKELIEFKQLNLIAHKWPVEGQFDVIFCRNVFIYFDKDTQSKIVYRFSELQKKDSVLFIGHSENIAHFTSAYELSGKTIYLKSE